MLEIESNVLVCVRIVFFRSRNAKIVSFRHTIILWYCVSLAANLSVLPRTRLLATVPYLRLKIWILLADRAHGRQLRICDCKTTRKKASVLSIHAERLDFDARWTFQLLFVARRKNCDSVERDEPNEPTSPDEETQRFGPRMANTPQKSWDLDTLVAFHAVPGWSFLFQLCACTDDPFVFVVFVEIFFVEISVSLFDATSSLNVCPESWMNVTMWYYFGSGRASPSEHANYSRKKWCNKQRI